MSEWSKGIWSKTSENIKEIWYSSKVTLGGRVKKIWVENERRNC